jgi:hypothetical protein
MRRPPWLLEPIDIGRAYKRLEDDRVKGNPARALSDIVMLVRYALGELTTLEPLPATIAGRFNLWLGREERVAAPIPKPARLALRDPRLHRGQRRHHARGPNGRPRFRRARRSPPCSRSFRRPPAPDSRRPPAGAHRMRPDALPVADIAQVLDNGSGQWDLPSSWVWSSLGEVAAINPHTDLNGLPDDAEIPFVPMAAVAEKTGVIDTSRRRPVAAVRKGYVRFCQHDVIFAKITPCMENGKVASLHGIEGGYAAGSTEFHVLRPGCIDTRYLWYWLVRRAFRAEAAHNMSGTAGQLRVPVDYLRSALVPLPPLAEQRRIVARIDELPAEVDEGEAALRRARQGLDTWRRALLKAVPQINYGDVANIPLVVPSEAESKEIARRVDDLLSASENGAATVKNSHKAATALRQSILKAAFEGSLVPQDPADEPASVLLARLRDSNHQTTTRRRRARAKEAFSHPSLPSLTRQSLDPRVEPAGED